MFRHFAVITLAITFCLAMFADGEKRQAITEQVEQRQAQNEALKAESDALGKKRFASKGMKFNDSRKAKGSFGFDPAVPDDDTGTSGNGPKPSLNLASYDSYDPLEAASLRESEFAAAYDSPNAVPPGLSEEEVRKYILAKKSKKSKKRATDAERQEMLEASRRRSGASDDGDED